MFFTISVNNKKIKAEKGETILSALNRNGIIIPTLCRMKDFTPTGACRLCVVEVEGRDRLVTACSQPVEEWMVIHTHSPRVIKARRTIVELLLSKHPDDCLYCNRNLNCELQNLAGELNIRERRIRGRRIRTRLDQSSPSIVREFAKCIVCGRCVRVCEEVITATTIDFINKGQQIHIGTALDKDFNFSSCIHCGQCMQVCPSGALHEKQNIAEVQEYLYKPEFIKVIQYTPGVVAGLAEELGLKPARETEKILNSVLRKIGFNKVFLSGFGTDILITEAARSLREKIEKGMKSPLYLSACPAWVKYAEQFMPSLLGDLSPLKPPQQIAGALIKSHALMQPSIKSQQIYSVAVTECTAMKFESRRDAMMRKGISDIDAVLTVRELAKLIGIFGIDISTSEGEPCDEPMDIRSAVAGLAGVSGGLTEGIIRTLIFDLGQREPEKSQFKKLRAGGNFRESHFTAGHLEIKVAVVDGLTGLDKLQASLASGNEYDMVEVMVCPGGCIHGAGMPFCSDREQIRNRARIVYQTEENDAVSVPLKSPSLLNHYSREKDDRSIYFTHFSRRDVLL